MDQEVELESGIYGKATLPFHNWAKPKKHLGSTLLSGTPLIVKTSRIKRWRAVSFKTQASIIPNQENLFVLNVKIQLIKGHIRIGVLHKNSSHYIDETFVVDPGIHVVPLLISGDIGKLVIRNFSRKREAAFFSLIECQTYQITRIENNAKFMRPFKPMNYWAKYYANYCGDSLREKMRAHEIKSRTPTKIMEWVEGLQLMIHPTNETSRALYISGTYEPNSLLLLKKYLRKNDVFLDIGANAGIYTLLASRCVGEKGKVISFEPSSREYLMLEENVQLNALQNVRCEKCAISNVSGVNFLNLAVDKHNGQNTLCDQFAYKGVNSNLKESVKVDTIDQYVKNHALNRIDFIKMDIEGAESLALQGAKQTFHLHRPLLLIEICRNIYKRNKKDLRLIHQFFQDYQYQVFSINDETGELYPNEKPDTWDDNIFVVPREKVQ